MLKKFRQLYQKYEEFWKNALIVQDKFPRTPLAFSPDFKYVLIGLTLWDAASEKKVACFYKGWLDNLAFTPDGRFALSGNRYVLTLWDASSGESIQKFHAHPHERCRWVNISPDGKYVMSASSTPSTLRMWDTASGEEINAFRPVRVGNESSIRRQGDRLWSATFSADGRYALTGMSSGATTIWEMASGKQIRSYEGHLAKRDRSVYDVCFSPDSRYALSVSKNGTKFWDTISGKEIRSFNKFGQFSPDGRYILSDADQGIRLWSVGSGKEICSFYAFSDEEWVVTTPDGFYNASPDGHKYVGVRVGNDVQPVEICKETCYRPDWVQEALENAERFGGSDAEGDAFFPETDALSDSDALSDILTLEGDDEAEASDDAEKPEIFLQIGKTGKVTHHLTCAALTPDNKYALSGGLDRKMRLWEVDSGKMLRSFNVYSYTNPNSIALSPDGQYALYASTGGMEVWELDSGKKIRTFYKSKGCNIVAFSPDGKYALGREKRLDLYETGSWQKIRTFAEDLSVTATTAAFSTDGKYILTGGTDTKMTLWDVDSGKAIRSFRGKEYPYYDYVHICSVAFSPDGKYGLAGGDDSVSRLWELFSGKLIRTFNTGDIKSLAISPDGRHALFCGYSDTMKLWDIWSGKQVRTFQGHQNEVNFATFSADGKYVLSASNDKTLKLWDAGSGKVLRTFKEHGLGLSAAGFSSDGRYALAGYGDTSLMVWDMASGKAIHALRGHLDPLNAVSFSPDGKYALSAGNDAAMKLWEVGSGKRVRSVNDYSRAVTGVLSPGGKYALTGRRLWDTEAGQLMKMEAIDKKAGRVSVSPLAFSPDGKHALIEIVKTLWLWDVASDKEIRSFKGHFSRIRCAAFSPDGRHILSGGYDATLRLWDTNSGTEIRAFRGHSNSVTSLAFSPDGEYALSGSEDRSMRLWSMASGKELLCFRKHLEPVVAVGFGPGGKTALSASKDKMIRTWSLASGKEVCRLVAFENDQWVALTSEGYYNASSDAHQYLSTRIHGKIYGIGKYKSTFNRPDKVQEILAQPGKFPLPVFQEEPESEKTAPVFEKYESRKYRIEKASRFLKIYDRKTDREIFFYDFGEGCTSNCDKDYGESDLAIKDYRISPDDKYVLFSIGDAIRMGKGGGSFHVYNIETKEEYNPGFENPQKRGVFEDITDLAFSTDGKFIRISYYGYDVDVIWNFETGKITDVIEKSPGLPVDLSASPGIRRE